MPVRKTPAIVLYEPGGFGDYIFYRPFLKYFKKAYPECKLVFVCPHWYSYFPKLYDSCYIDKVIPYDNLEFRSSGLYRKLFYDEINKNYNVKNLVRLLPASCEFGVTRCSRDIAKHIKSPKRTICLLGKSKIKKKARLEYFNNKIYIEQGLFRSETLRRFFEKLTSLKIPESETTAINIDFKQKREHIGIQLKASIEKKSYPAEKYALVLNHILKNTDSDTKLMFFGSKKDSPEIENLIARLNAKSRCVNLAGVMNLDGVAYVMSQLKLFLSLDTGNTHLAQALGCPTIALCGGYYYEDYFPYPEPSNIEYIFPDRFFEIVEKNKNKTKEEMDELLAQCLVKEIDEQDIIKAVDKYLIHRAICKV